MRHTVDTGRSAASGGRRMLFFLGLLALLFAALTTGYADAADVRAGRCPTRVDAPSVTSAADRICDTTSHVLTSTEGIAHHHPGNGFRRLCHATACHLRHHVPSGPNGKALRESHVEEPLAAPGRAAFWAALPSAATGLPARVTVLRC
ncbi:MULTISPECIES: hypothetical protein [unclassified Streptomyces]|uniref:hypothetical protein n=1 Tax=unclassified Streptomyces TaxID=2593676 RepID=UPI000370C26A|nr:MULTISPECIES: hypothetical protein [unclassified Streptomyces]MYT32604.1 hypothetical protein [Streptomyces sp. SID8354]